MGDHSTRPVPQVPALNSAAAWIGMLGLVLGTLVYVLDRPFDSAPFFNALSLAHVFPGSFGRIGASLPTFAHAFAFSLLTAAWLGGTRTHALAACVAWFGIDTAFEVGQHARLAPTFAASMPDWFDFFPVLRGADRYFLLGTFDPGDLIAIGLGAALAYPVFLWTTRAGASS